MKQDWPPSSPPPVPLLRAERCGLAALLGFGEVPELAGVPVGEAALTGLGEGAAAFLRCLDADAGRGDAGLYLLLDVRAGLGHEDSPRPMASQQRELPLPSRCTYRSSSRKYEESPEQTGHGTVAATVARMLPRG